MDRWIGTWGINERVAWYAVFVVLCGPLGLRFKLLLGWHGCVEVRDIAPGRGVKGLGYHSLAKMHTIVEIFEAKCAPFIDIAVLV